MKGLGFRVWEGAWMLGFALFRAYKNKSFWAAWQRERAYEGLLHGLYNSSVELGV